MPSNKAKSLDYQSLSKSAKKGGVNSGDQTSLKAAGKSNKIAVESNEKKKDASKSLVNPAKKAKNQFSPDSTSETSKVTGAESFVAKKSDAQKTNTALPKTTDLVGRQKQGKQERKAEKDRELLSSDYWLARNGHGLTYFGLYLFSILVLFRPYELVSSLSFLSATAFYFAAVTLAIYIPMQLSTEGSLTMLSTEVKCILALTFFALLTIPIGKDAVESWTTFNDTFIKIVLMFVVMVNVVRTRQRLVGLIWLSLAVGIYLSFTALDLYMKGELKTEGYRVAVNVGGLFGNPNDMALHFVTITPIAIVLGIASRNKVWRIFYFIMAGLFVAANMVTFSRGGFLGLIVSTAVLAWKIGRKNRLNVLLASTLAGGLFILLAPGNYGLRLLSIFIPGLDPVGSSDQRKQLLFRSIFVTIRNPWGIGMGNSPLMNDNNLQWHNAYMQIASELSVFGLLVYLIFLISPLRKLGAIERTLFARGEYDWFYYMAIGLQASIIGYMVSSFFVSVAYNWFVYYLIAYAVAFRRIYQIEKGLKEEVKSESIGDLGKKLIGWQSA
jgi:putative inorganic carbon (hco3(-)) transporter